MAENEEKKVKENVSVTITVQGFVPGMEADPEFIGCSFRRVTTFNSEQVKERNDARAQLSADVCKKYSVKPLGATSAPTGGITKKTIAIIQALAVLTMDVGKIQKVLAKKGITVSLEDIQANLG